MLSFLCKKTKLVLTYPGTTYSAVAVYRKGNVEIIANGQGNRTTASYVAFDDKGSIVGNPASYQAANNPQNTIYCKKSSHFL